MWCRFASRAPRLPHSIPQNHQRISRSITSAKAQQTHIKTQRPTLDDVQRLSEGRAAKTRGYGSRQVPHRLNSEERQQYDIAKARGILTLKGSGYRRERKGSPLANLWRQLSDATGRPCFLIEQYGPNDVVIIDLSTLRLLDTSQAERALLQHIATEFQVDPLPAGAHSSPFTVIVPGAIIVAEEEEEQEKEEESSNSEGEEESKNIDDSDEVIELSASEEHILTAPIWQQKPKLIFFELERPAAKALGKAVAGWKP